MQLLDRSLVLHLAHHTKITLVTELSLSTLTLWKKTLRMARWSLLTLMALWPSLHLQISIYMLRLSTALMVFLGTLNFSLFTFTLVVV
jgi:hypothetical protein